MNPPETTARGASPVTTLTVFRFARGARFWAFAQMAFARPLLRNVPGLRFHRLMGAGRGLGFTRKPDWGRYALLAVWDSEASARAFLDSSRFIRRYRGRAAGSATAVLRTLSAHGAWDGANPFLPAAPLPAGGDGPLAVLTRATIRPGRLRAFWQQVAPVSRARAGADGLVASIGIGELPFVRQATFSLWRSAEDMQAFAYRSPEHRQVVRRTRDESWYREDLFARFAVVETLGEFP